MTPSAKAAYADWVRRSLEGTIQVVPHHRRPNGIQLKCPSCGSTDDFVLYIYRRSYEGIAKVDSNSEDAIYLKCFNPQFHPMGRGDYSQMNALRDYLRDGDTCIPIEKYSPSSPPWGSLGCLTFLVCFAFIGAGLYLVFGRGQTWLGIALVWIGGILSFLGKRFIRRSV